MAPQFSIETKKIIMDTKLVREFGTEILSYRLRTVRQKKRMQYEDFDKQLIQLHKEDRSLGQKQKALGWEPLTPPVQKGWKRFFVLREDVARSKHAEFFENILKKINTYDWSHRKDFKVRKKRYGKEKYGVKPQSLLKPIDYHFEQMNFNVAERSLFYEAWKSDHKKRLYKYYVFKEPWRFVLRVRPNMIDKVRIRDEELERRMNEIDEYLDWNKYRRRQTKLLMGNTNCWYRGERDREKYEWKGKPVHHILNDISADQ